LKGSDYTVIIMAIMFYDASKTSDHGEYSVLFRKLVSRYGQVYSLSFPIWKAPTAGPV